MNWIKTVGLVALGSVIGYGIFRLSLYLFSEQHIELLARWLIDCSQQLIPLFSGMVHIAMGAFIYHMGVKFGGGK